MGVLKRICMVVFALAGLFSLAAFGLAWFGPWTAGFMALFSVEGWCLAVLACSVVSALGLLATFFRAFGGRRVRVIEVATVDGGVISVSKDAIAAQARHIVEADGSCTAARVRVDAKARGHVRVHVRVLPHESVDVVVKGAELHEELLDGLAAVCGDKVEDVSLEFVEPEQITVGSAPAADAPAADDVAAAAEEPQPAVVAELSVGAPSPDSTSEIRVPMGTGALAVSRDAAKEA